MGAFEVISPGIMEASMEHHPLKIILLTWKGTALDLVVGLGWYTPEKISGVPKGLLNRDGNPV